MKEFEDAMLDLAWENLKYEMDRFKNINTKGLALITINGTLVSLLVGTLENARAGCTLFYMMAMAFLIVAIGLCIASIHSAKIDALSIQNIITAFNGQDNDTQIRGIVATVAASESSFRKASEAKSIMLDYSIYSLSFGVLSLILYLITLVL